MEFSSHNSHESDDSDSKESSTDSAPRMVRVPVPASVMHGARQHAEKPAVELFKPPAPEKAPEQKPPEPVENLIPEQRRPSQMEEMARHARREADPDDDEEDEDEDDSTDKPKSSPLPHKDPSREDHEAIEVPLKLREEWTPLDSNPPVAEEIARTQAYDIPSAEMPQIAEHEPPVVEAIEAVEDEPAHPTFRPQQPPVVAPMPRVENQPPSPEPPKSQPFEAFSQPEQPAEEMPEPPTQAGGGGGRPPIPPPGNSAEMPMPAQPGPESTPNALGSTGHNAMPSFLGGNLSPAERLLIDSKLSRLELSRRRGDALTGIIAGWAFLRTMKNRRMIKENERTATRQFAAQETASTNLAQQNTLLRQRVEQLEQQQAHPPVTVPERVANTAPVVAATSPMERAKTAQAEAAEKIRLIHEQQEKLLRQQELNVPPEHEVVRSGWHSIEVDAKTGKAVEKPTTFEYGKAFNQERRQEQMQDRVQDNAPQMQGGAQGVGSQQPGMTPLPPLYGSRPSQQHVPGRLPRDNSPMQQMKETASDPWVWAGVVFIILVFLTAAIL